MVEGGGSLPRPEFALAQDGPTEGLGYLLPHGYELELKTSTRSKKRSREAPRYLAHTSGNIAANISHPHPHTPQPCQGGGGGGTTPEWKRG